MATRYRPIRKWGNSLVIKLNPADEKDLNLKVGDLIDIEDAVRKTSVPQELAEITKKKAKKK